MGGEVNIICIHAYIYMHMFTFAHIRGRTKGELGRLREHVRGRVRHRSLRVCVVMDGWVFGWGKWGGHVIYKVYMYTHSHIYTNRRAHLLDEGVVAVEILPAQLGEGEEQLQHRVL